MAEDLGKRIGAFGQNVWKKAQGAVSIVTLNSDIAAKTRELTDLYADIGKAYCIQHPEDAVTAFPELCNHAFALANEISQLQEQVLLEKGLLKCQACGAMVPAPAAFCPTCGAAMPKPEPQPEPEPAEPEPNPNACPNCGADMEPEDVYCASCGAKR